MPDVAKTDVALPEAGVLDVVEGLARGGAVTLTSLTLRKNMSYERWESLISALGQFHRASRWWPADAMIHGEGAYGETYAQASDLTGLKVETLTKYVSVARAVQPSRRRQNLPFSVHEAVAWLDPIKQTEWLDRAEAEQWKTRDVRGALREAGLVKVVEQPAWTPVDSSNGSFEPRADDVVKIARRIRAEASTDGDRAWFPIETFQRLCAVLGE